MKGVIRTVSLTQETAEIASKLGNFSEFVRTALLIHAGDIESFHTMRKDRRMNGGWLILKELMTQHSKSKQYNMHRVSLKSFKCDPFDSGGQCPACWPPMDGPIEEQVRHTTNELVKDWLETQNKGVEEE